VAGTGVSAAATVRAGVAATMSFFTTGGAGTTSFVAKGGGATITTGEAGEKTGSGTTFCSVGCGAGSSGFDMASRTNVVTTGVGSDWGTGSGSLAGTRGLSSVAGDATETTTGAVGATLAIMSFRTTGAGAGTTTLGATTGVAITGATTLGAALVTTSAN